MKFTKVDNGIFKTSIKQQIKNENIEIQSDKFLFDRTKTIGFRTDKKLHKFVGIRDGYSKQLEFTVNSVVIDGDEKIAANRVNFSTIDIEGEKVIHGINGLDFYNEVDLSNYKNMIKVEEAFIDIDIIYELHIKGISIKNNRTNGHTVKYIENEYSQFEFSDETNGNVLFRIEKPYIFGDNGKIYDIIIHELYEIDNRIYYKKTIRGNNITQYPLYVDANVSFNVSTFSNLIGYNNDEDESISWENAKDGSTVIANTSNVSFNSFEEKTSELITDWTPTNMTEPYEFYYDDVDFFYMNPPLGLSYIESDKFDVVGGEKITINVYPVTFDPGVYPDVEFLQYDSGNTLIKTDTYLLYIEDYHYFYPIMEDNAVKAQVVFNNPGVIYEIEIFYSVVKFGIPEFDYLGTYYESFVNRQFLHFDTTDIHKIALSKMELEFILDAPSTGNYAIQKANTTNDETITTSDYNNYQGGYYATFSASATTHVVDLGQDAVDDFVDRSVTKLVIREYENDYINNILPISPYQDTMTHNWSYQLNIELDEIIVSENTVINFPLETDGFGVIYSTADNYDDTYSGNTYSFVAHNSTQGSFDTSSTYTYDLTDHELYRTFLNFDTTLLSVYKNYIFKNVTLNVKNINFNDDISINKGLQDNSIPLQESDFLNFGDFYTHVENVTLDSLVEIPLSENVIETSGYTEFVIRSKEYDFSGDTSASSLIDSGFGIDFSETYFQVELEPYLIYGLNYIKSEYGKDIDLYASRNTPDGEIYWSNNSGMTDIIGSGNTVSINTINYHNGDYIYAAIIDSSGVTLSYNTLSILLDLYNNDFDTLPERNYNVHDVDIDSVYFKYHKCISGVCYAYVRELDDVYEQNYQVSDGDDIGSYNMYNEFDIVDEFYSNSHEVEVVGKLDEMDLSISYKKINDITIHEGTRVLLYSTYPTENDGVYVADYNLLLHKTDELDDEDSAFRYKVHINAGDYLDYEFHTQYYSDVEEIDDPDDFDYLDGSIYGDTVIDFETYGETLYDSNVL